MATLLNYNELRAIYLSLKLQFGCDFGKFFWR